MSLLTWLMVGCLATCFIANRAAALRWQLEHGILEGSDWYKKRVTSLYCLVEDMHWSFKPSMFALGVVLGPITAAIFILLFVLDIGRPTS